MMNGCCDGCHGLSCEIEVAIGDELEENWKHNHKIVNFVGHVQVRNGKFN